jgi:hypothetical protein
MRHSGSPKFDCVKRMLKVDSELPLQVIKYTLLFFNKFEFERIGVMG